MNSLVTRNGLVILGSLPSGAGNDQLTLDAATKSVGTVPATDLSVYLPRALNNNQIFIGNGSNLATAVTPSGHISISNIGVVTIQPNVIVDGMINPSAQIDRVKLKNGTPYALVLNSVSGVMTELLPGTLNQVLKMGAGGPTWQAGGAVTNFTDLGDVPSSYVGQALKTIRVNAGQTGLEFYTVSLAPFADNIALIKNNADNTKLAVFNASAITTATTRTYNLPDVTGGTLLLGNVTNPVLTAATIIQLDDTNSLSFTWQDDLFATGAGSVSIGATNGFLLQSSPPGGGSPFTMLVSGSVLQVSSPNPSKMSITGTWTANANNQFHANLTGGITGRAGNAGDSLFGYKFTPTLTTGTNGQTLTAVLVNPTFSGTGTFYPFRIQNNGTEVLNVTSSGTMTIHQSAGFPGLSFGAAARAGGVGADIFFATGGAGYPMRFLANAGTTLNMTMYDGVGNTSHLDLIHDKIGASVATVAATSTGTQISSVSQHFNTSLWNGAAAVNGWMSWRAVASTVTNLVQSLVLYNSTGASPSYGSPITVLGYTTTSRPMISVGDGTVGMAFEAGVGLRIGGLAGGGGWAVKFVDSNDATTMMQIRTASVGLVNDQYIAWNTTATTPTTSPTILQADGVDTYSFFAADSGTSATATKILLYNIGKRGSVTNYERGKFGWNSNTLEIGTQSGGSGAARSVKIISTSAILLNPQSTTNVVVNLSSSGEFQVTDGTKYFRASPTNNATYLQDADNILTHGPTYIQTLKNTTSAGSTFQINAATGISGAATGQNLTLLAGAGYQVSGNNNAGDLNLGTQNPLGSGNEGSVNIQTRASGKLSFFNIATPVVKQAGLTAITHTAPGTPDYAIQDLTNVGGFAFVTKDEGNTVLSVIKAMHDAMKAYGLLT